MSTGLSKREVVFNIFRKEPNLAAKQIAEMVGLSPQQIYNYKSRFNREFAQPQSITNDDYGTVVEDAKLIKSIGIERAEAAIRLLKLINK